MENDDLGLKRCVLYGRFLSYRGGLYNRFDCTINRGNVAYLTTININNVLQATLAPTTVKGSVTP